MDLAIAIKSKNQGLRILLSVILISSLFLPKSWGLETLKVLEASQDKGIIFVNYGRHEGANEGDVARFYLRVDPKKFQGSIYVGKGVIKRAFPSTSLWKMDGAFQKQYLVPGQQMVIFNWTNYKQTKQRIDLKRKMVVLSNQLPHRLDELQDKEGRGKPQALAKEEKDFLWGKKITVIPQETGSRRRLSIVDLAEWNRRQERAGERSGGLGDLKDEEGEEDYEQAKTSKEDPLDTYYVTKVKDGPTREDRVEEILEEEFDSLVKGHMKRGKDIHFNRDEFYREQKRVDGLEDVREKGDFPNSYDLILEQRQARERGYQKIRKYIRKQEGNWSDDLSDEQLRRFVRTNGLEYEQDRQVVASLSNTPHELSLAGTVNFLKSGYDRDIRGLTMPFKVSFGYEFFGSSLHEFLERWSVKANLRWGETYHVPYGLYSRIFDKDMFLGISLYPFHLPFELKKVITFVRAGFLFGESLWSLGAGDRGEERYNISSFPSLAGGIKYRWTAPLGVFLQATFDQINYDVQETSTSSTFPESAQLRDLQVGGGFLFNF